VSASSLGEMSVQGAGLGIVARRQEDGPETWEASYLHRDIRCDGGPVINLRLVVVSGAAATGRRSSAARW
jgi:hypothetical protein